MNDDSTAFSRLRSCGKSSAMSRGYRLEGGNAESERLRKIIDEDWGEGMKFYRAEV